MKISPLFEKTEAGVKCLLCNHYCRIKNGGFGICKVRKNIHNEIYSLVYGYPVAINNDPIEKKPLFHFLPGSFTYSLGTLGCNFKCANCQNWDISQPEDVKKIIEKSNYIEPEKIIKEALNAGSKSISYTYNEPTVFFEYALDIMKLAHKKGLKNIWVSNGYMSKECLKQTIPYLDAVNIDIKSFDEDFYKTNCHAKLSPILDNLDILKKKGVHIEITTLIIPSLSDDKFMLTRLAEYIYQKLGEDTPWHISKFSAEISWKLGTFEETSSKLLLEACKIGKKAGLNHVYIGNMPGNKWENTYCPKCKKIVILRYGYKIEKFDYKGTCPKCGYSLKIKN